MKPECVCVDLDTHTHDDHLQTKYKQIDYIVAGFTPFAKPNCSQVCISSGLVCLFLSNIFLWTSCRAIGDQLLGDYI